MLTFGEKMAQEEPRRWKSLAVAGGVALIALALLVTVLSQEMTQIAPLPPTAVPANPADPAVAFVNGQPIGRNFWVEAVQLDQVMSGLAGVPAPSPEETLERLINEVLVLQTVSQRPPTRDEVEARIAALEAAWGVEDEQVVAALTAAGLDREALARSVSRLLLVQRSQEQLVAEGTPTDDWLTRLRGQAEITINYQQMETAFLSLQPTAPPSPLPTPEPPPPLAVDFTLERAGGGSLTLSEQLALGPVVLVFFQRCG